jgi:predicted amidohydrolase YtcJ
MSAAAVLPNEILLTDGPILTMTEPARVDAVLVRGDRLVAVGTAAECQAAAVGTPERVDLRGATLMPGFVDAHCHPLMHGQFRSWVDCSWESAPTIDDVVAALANRGAELAGPVRGKGFHHGNVAESRMLTRYDLDRVATDREVLVFHSSGHGAIVNSYALERRGITGSTADPDGGHLGRDEYGEPNGEIWDAAADWLTGPEGVKIGNNGPNFHVGDDLDVLADLLAAAQQEFHSVGVTTVVDAQVTSREMRTYFRLRGRGQLTMRTEMLVISSLLGELENLGLGARLGDDLLAFSGIKLYVDGALTGGTARFSEPYCCDPENHGYLYHERDELVDMILRADALGLQAATHAQGDAAIAIVLEAHERVAASGPRTDARHRIEHCGMPTKGQIQQIAERSLWPVTQPQYLRRFGDEFIRALGDRAHRLMPLAEFKKAEVPVVLSSDAPVCPPLPLEAVYAAVTRRTLGDQELVDDAEAISVQDALIGHTRQAAAAVHREGAVGSLAPGLFADLVILESDPTVVPVEAIPSIAVRETWVGGRRVFAQSS